MANKRYDKEEGVWRTISGRRVFIRTGQSLSDAMKESGKFKNMRKDIQDNVEFKDIEEKSMKRKGVTAEEYQRAESREHQLREEYNKLAREKGTRSEEAYLKEEELYDARQKYESLMEKDGFMERKFQMPGTLEVDPNNYHLSKELRKKDMENDLKWFEDMGQKYGQDLSKNEDYLSLKEQYESEFAQREKKIKAMNPNDKNYDVERNHLESQQRDLVAKINELDKKQGLGYSQSQNKLMEDYEYNLYKKAKENPDSIDPMTENSTDWERLEEKYRDKYAKEIDERIKEHEGIKESNRDRYWQMEREMLYDKKKEVRSHTIQEAIDKNNRKYEQQPRITEQVNKERRKWEANEGKQISNNLKKDISNSVDAKSFKDNTSQFTVYPTTDDAGNKMIAVNVVSKDNSPESKKLMDKISSQYGSNSITTPRLQERYTYNYGSTGGNFKEVDAFGRQKREDFNKGTNSVYELNMYLKADQPSKTRVERNSSKYLYEAYTGDTSDLKSKHTKEGVANYKKEANDKIRAIITGKSRADKGLEKYGLRVERDNSAQKEFGKRYFGKNVEVINDRTGKKIYSSYDNYWNMDNVINAKPSSNSIKSEEWHQIKSSRHSPVQNKDVTNEFNYYDYLKKPVNTAKNEGDTIGQKVAQYKLDKQYLKQHEYEIKTATKTADRYLRTKNELDNYNLKKQYQGTYEYLKNTTNMSGEEILEYLKKIKK